MRRSKGKPATHYRNPAPREDPPHNEQALSHRPTQSSSLLGSQLYPNVYVLARILALGLTGHASRDPQGYVCIGCGLASLHKEPVRWAIMYTPVLSTNA